MKQRSFKVGDKVVYPGHGVGEITGIKTQSIAGTEQKFLDIALIDCGMKTVRKIMVPIAQVESVGLRAVVDRKTVEKVYTVLKKRDYQIDQQTWNRRFREYSQKLNTGSVFEIAEVLRDLSVLSGDKELSFGEKRMLDKAQSLLVTEISVAKARPTEKIMGELRAIFS